MSDVMLLERDEPLARLGKALAAARGGGQLVALSGEAGIGKSTLLTAFAGRDTPDARVLWGYCEALGTPRPLGPLLDMAPGLGGRTADALAAGAARHDVFAAFIEDLARPALPTVAIFEDVHWADDATVDLLQYVGRRIASTRAVILMSYRDDEVDADHPIHRVLGGWPHASVHRIPLRPLSLAAVEQIARRARNAAGTHDAHDAHDVRDARAVHALTGGNPFFVTQVLQGTDGAVPASVREAVLARRARLGPAARAVLDLVSVIPLRAELSLVASILDVTPADVETCVTAGLLCCDPLTIAFRHELARLAVADALPAPRVQDGHRRVLKALLARPDRERLLARIVHHAEGCGDLDALLEYAPAAARQAAALGAHREAVDHYRRALRHADRLSDAARAAVFEALAYEHYLTSNVDAASEAQQRALAVWRRIGTPESAEAIGRNVRWLSRLAWFSGDREEAQRHADEAIAVLNGQPSAELAMAFSNRSQLDMLQHDVAGSTAWGTLAIDLARKLGAHDVLCHALNNVGTVRLLAGEPGGREQLEESLQLSLAHDYHEHAARAYTNLSSCYVQRREYDAARPWLDAGLRYSTERDLDAWRLYILAFRARMHAETGLWPAACDDARTVLAEPRVPTVCRIVALAALGLVMVRRGDAHPERPLDEAMTLARKTAEGQRLVPVLLARAELAWLTGRRAGVLDAAREALAAIDANKPAYVREPVWYWLWKAGALQPGALQPDAIQRDVAGSDGPYACLIRGDWRSAAMIFQRRGCPYERAQALVEGDLAAVRDALEIFQSLGAAPAADSARQRLRHMGLTRVPRGQRSSTRAHPAGLTTREAEVLALLARGLHNPQIADRLFVSPKTVEHHVSSILAKLDVPTRDAAAVHARREGWLVDRRSDPVAHVN